MPRHSLMIAAVFTLSLVGCGGKRAADETIPQEEVDRKNPVAADAASIAAGKQAYDATDCAICHGKEGEGKGPVSRDVPMNLHDWRKPDWTGKFTDGELSYIILKGKGRMPKYSDRETPDQVWQIVNYIRSMPGGAAH